MAEVLGIVASVISLLDVSLRASTGLAEILNVWKDGPAILCALQNDIAELSIILDEIRHTSKQLLNDSDRVLAFKSKLDNFLKAAEQDLNRLDEVVTSLKNLSRPKRAYRWTKRQQEAIRIHERLRDVRTKIHELLMTRTASTTSRIELEILSIRQTHATDHASTLNCMKAIQDMLIDLKRVNGSDEGDDHKADRDAKTSQIHDFLSQCSLETSTTLMDPMELSRQADLPIDTLDQGLGKSTTTPATRQLFLPASRDGADSTSSSTTSSLPQDHGSFTTFELQRWGLRCDDGCPCSCHSRSRSWNTTNWGTSKILTSVVGSLFLGYTGVPVLSTACDSDACQSNRATSIHVRYVFPAWLLYRTLEIAMRMSTTSAFQLNIIIRPRVKWSRSNLFGMIDAGDFNGVKGYVDANPASVHTVWDRIASSPLHYAVTSARIDINIIRFLVNRGSSLDLQNDFGLSATQHVSLKIFRKLYSSQEAQEMEALFPISISRGVDHDFSLIHKIVLGISPNDLASYLDSGDPSINEQLNHRDIFGNTPLHWAASLADLQSVQLLITRGTNPNIKNNMGKTPLLVAASTQNFSKTVDVVKLLVEFGANPLPPVPSDGWGPFQWACHFQNLPLAEFLLRHGADINQRSTRNGATSLIHAAQKGRVDLLEFLLNRGSDINVSDFDGRTPLYHALYDGHYDAVRLLIMHQADCTTVDRIGQTLLHCVAERGDVEMMKLLTGLQLKAWNLEFKNAKGMTAAATYASRGAQDGVTVEDSFHRREEINFWRPVVKTMELNSTFHALIASPQEEQEVEDDSFFDALESVL